MTSSESGTICRENSMNRNFMHAFQYDILSSHDLLVQSQTASDPGPISVTFQRGGKGKLSSSIIKYVSVTDLPAIVLLLRLST